MKIMLNSKISKKLRFFCFFIAFFLIFLNICLFILGIFRPVFEEKAVHAARIKATDIINKATENVFFDISSPELVIINKDEQGSITSVNANTIEINKLKSKLSKSIQEIAEASENSKVYIPLVRLPNGI